MIEPSLVEHKELGRIKPENVHCICRNYARHAAELGNKVNEEPVFFEKSNTTINSGATISIPEEGDIQHELELVMLFGKGGDHIDEQDVRTHISGITLGIDLTNRSFQTELKSKRLPWFLSKSFRNSAWVGTFESPDWQKWSQDFWITNNGVIKQQGRISDMVFSLEKQVSYLSGILPIAQGDILFTGTPEGVGSLAKGDTLTLGIGKEKLYTINII